MWAPGQTLRSVGDMCGTEYILAHILRACFYTLGMVPFSWCSARFCASQRVLRSDAHFWGSGSGVWAGSLEPKQAASIPHLRARITLSWQSY